MNDAIPFCDSGLGKIIMHKIHHVREEEGFGGGVDYVEAALVIESREDCETFAAAEVTRSAGEWFGMDDDWAAERSYGSGFELEGDVEVLPGGYERGNVELIEEVYSELGLREEFVPKEVGECSGYSGEDREKMGVEGMDHLFSCIVAVHVGGDELEVFLPFFFNLEFVCGASFVL